MKKEARRGKMMTYMAILLYGLAFPKSNLFFSLVGMVFSDVQLPPRGRSSRPTLVPTE